MVGIAGVPPSNAPVRLAQQRLDQVEPRWLVLLEVDQFSQPLGIGAERQSTDQRRTVSLRAGEHVEQLACAALADSGPTRRADEVTVDQASFDPSPANP